jgi:hypothetical protein
LLREAQGQHDLAIAKGQAARLLGTMRRSGATPSNATEGDAIGDGALSIVAWRNLYGPRLLSESAGLVCWRACVASVARLDMLGESIEAWRRDDGGGDGWDLLTGSALPLPQLCGDSSREDKASRLRWQRARGQRFAKLGRRVASIKLRATGRRVAVVDKVQRAAVQLLHGASLDEAALAAGFKASGQGRQAVRAGDRLTQAVRRLGFRVQFNARDHEHQQEHARGACVPLSLATVAAWHVQPSATLPLQSGRGDKQWVPLLRRLQRKRARVAKLLAAWVARAARVERASAKLASLERWQARQGAKSGLWAGLITSGNLPQYGHGKRRRM